MPSWTGTGKTVVFAALIQRRTGRALVLAHRDELIQQAAEKIRLVMAGANVGIVKGERNETGFPVVVASVQTVSRENRLAQLGHEFSTIVVDEAHHAAADTYKRTLESLGSFRERGPLTVGFTATADRSDNRGLDSVFQEIVYEKNILEMIRAGYLCDLAAKQVRLEADFNALHTRNGEFIDRECEELLLGADIQTHGVEAYLEHAAGRKAFLFVPTVHLAHDMVKAFNDRGIPAASVDGATDTEVRRETLQKFSRGDIRVLSNCMVLAEGYDEPSADCILMARPTKSRSLYRQIIGRGTRLHPGKDDCLVLDFVGSTSRHDLVTTASLFGITPKTGETVCEAIQREEAERESQGRLELERGRIVAEAVEARFHWVQVADVFTLTIGAGMVLMRPDRGAWTATFYGNDRNEHAIAERLPLSYAQGAAEDFAREKGIAALMNPNASWRKRPASPKQLAALRKMRIPASVNLTAGEASDLISKRIAVRCGA